MSQTEKPAGIFGCRPILYAKDVGASMRYYTEALGFKVGFRWSNETMSFLQAGQDGRVGFGSVFRDAVQVMLCEPGQGNPGMWLHLDVQTPEEIDALHEEWTAKGANILEPPHNRPWSMYEMRVTDPDGHVLRVSSPAKPT
jgi:uncharacterized glyoxalase superfamily protein PhnB